MAAPHSLTAGDDELDVFDAALLPEEEAEDRRQTRALDVRIRRINARVNRYVSITFNEMGAAGASDTANLLSGLSYINREDESDVAGWERFVQMLFSEHLQSARILYARLHRELERGRDAMSHADLAEWEAFYRSPAHEYKHKEVQIEHILPHEVDQNIAVRLERDRLLEKAKEHSVPVSHALSDNTSFLSMPLSRRQTAVAALREDVRQFPAEMAAAHAAARNQLLGAAGGEKAVISLDEAYRWLRRAVDRADTAKDVETFVRSDITPMLARAERTRAEYDEVEGVLQSLADRVPTSFQRRARAAFLTLPPEGRQAYVESARNAARAATAARHAEEAEAKAAALEEQSLRIALAAGDWRGAKVHLDALTALDPRRPSLKSLVDQVDAAQAEGMKAEAVAESRESLETSLKTVGHSSLSSAYAAALSAGAEQFEAFTAQVEKGAEKEKTPVSQVKNVPAKEQEEVPAPTLRQPKKEVVQPKAPMVKKQKPVDGDDDDNDESKSDENESESEDESPTVVEAEEGDSVVETVAELSDEQEEKGKKVGLALKADGDAISTSKQAETAKIHPWLKHHLGVLARHGARFRPQEEEEVA